MRNLVLTLSLIILGIVGFAQKDTARSFNFEDIEVFIKSAPIGAYTVIDDFKCPSTQFKNTKTGAKYTGDGGLNRILEGIRAAKAKVKKGKIEEFDAIIATKPGKITLIKLTDKQHTTMGQLCITQTEKKTKKMVFICSYPTRKFETIETRKFVEGGLGETYRGGNSMDIMINGFLDKAMRKVKKGKMEAFDALYIDKKYLGQGYLGVTMYGDFIRFTE